MPASWLSDWATNDLVSTVEFRKGVGAVYDNMLGSSVASVDFSGLPTTYAHLMIVAYLRSDTAAPSSNVLLRFNNDSAANYHYQQGYWNNGGVSNVATVASTAMVAGFATAATATANRFGALRIFIPYYANSANHKQIEASWGLSYSDLVAGQIVGQHGGVWLSTAAINRVTISVAGNIVAGSRVTVYVMGA